MNEPNVWDWVAQQERLKPSTTPGDERAAALLCAGYARDHEDLRIILTTLGMAEFCRFCRRIAVIRVALSRGCACYPDDSEQWLCYQHWKKSEPLGKTEVLEDRLGVG